MDRINLPARLENLGRFIEFVTAFAEGHGFSKGQTDRITLCLEEAVVNICNYAYPDDPDGKIEISLIMDGKNDLMIRITDSGVPFDIFTHEDPDISLGVSERKAGGLGIFFIKKLMDEIKYERKDNQNILTMILRRQS
ncbi:MAG: ATP-binding protein [Deltaproteobacteria bacterium]|nr:ATP-binding protein [Deltaproteobacteria bacterium]